VANEFNFKDPLAGIQPSNPILEEEEEEQQYRFNSILEKNKNKEFIDRIVSPEKYPEPTLKDDQGRKQTHFMSADLDEDNNWIVYPQIILKNGEYKRVGMQEAIQSNNAINFGKDQQLAQDFARNYKTKKFKDFYKEDQPTEYKEFNFNNPLQDIPLAGGLTDILVKPIAGFMEEAEQKYPDTAFENTKYLKDSVKHGVDVALRDRAPQTLASLNLQAAEAGAEILKGERMISFGPGFDSVADLNMMLSNRKKYERDPEYKEKIDSALKKEQKQFNDEWTSIEKRIQEKQKRADLGEYGLAVSSGAESLSVITGGVLANAATFGMATPAVTGGVVSYFALQTQAAEYAEARKQGMDHNKAMVYAGLQGAFEAGTEYLPVTRFFKPFNKKTIGGVLKEGLTNVGLEVGTENVNSLLQEANSLAFGLQSELKTAYDNRNNPLYDGPTISEVLVDIAGHTTLSSLFAGGSMAGVRAAGGVLYTDDVKNYVRQFKDNPDLDDFVKEFEFNVRNSQLNYQAIDRAAVRLLNPETYEDTVSADEVLAEELLKNNYSRTEKVADTDSEPEKDAKTKIEERFPEEETTFDFNDPLNTKKEPKQSGVLTEEIDLELSDSKNININLAQFLQEESIPSQDETPLNLEKIKNKSVSQEELDTAKNRIVIPKSFPQKEFIREDDNKRFDEQTWYKYRDFNPQEQDNAARAIIHMLDAGMPIDIFTDVKFMGMHTKDNRFKNFIPTLGTYVPQMQGVTFAPISGISDLNFDSDFGRTFASLDTFIHELGHHIDFTLGKVNPKLASKVIAPATSDSPLFVLPSIRMEGGRAIIGETGGEIAMETFNLYNVAESNNLGYYQGRLLGYPLNEFLAYGDRMNEAQLRNIPIEILGQLHLLYYTNKELLRNEAPKSFKLIEDINDAISVDNFTSKNEGLQRVFRTSSAKRGITISERGEPDTTDRRGVEQEPTGPGVVSEVQADERDDLRPEVSRLAYTSLLEFIKDNPDGFTVDPQTLESPSSGFVVAPIKAFELVIDQNEIDDNAVRDLARNIKALSEQTNQNVFAGGWFNSEDGKYYLDATVAFDTIEDALYTAQAADQLAIFDLGTFNEIRTEEGIKNLQETGRYSDQTADERRRNIQQLEELFSQPRSSDQRVQPTEVLREATEGTIETPDIGTFLTAQDASFLFRAYSYLQYMAVDKLDRLKYFNEKLKGYLPEAIKDLDIIRSTDTFHGKVKYGLDEAVNETDVILKLLKDSGISLDTFNKFLKNLHAPERNKFINEKYSKDLPALEQKLATEPDIAKIPIIKGQITKAKNILAKYQDSGSGIKTDQAIQALEELGIAYSEKTNKASAINKQGKALLDAFALLKEYQGKTLQIYRDQDLVSEEALADWDERYNYYVPLVGFAVDTIDANRPETGGGGRSLYGSVIPDAKGRTSESGSPFEQAVSRRSQAVVLGERNAINKELATLFRAFPDKKLWSVKGAKKFDKPHKWDGESSLIPFKENGKTMFLEIKDERLAKGLDSWGNAHIGNFWGFFRGMTGLLSSMFTAWNPEFMVGNFFRDYQAGYFNLMAEKEMGRAMGMKLTGALSYKKMPGIINELRKGYVSETLKDLDPEAYAYFDAFRRYGAQTGYINAKDIDQIEKEMLKLSKAHSGSLTNPKEVLTATAGFVESMNNMIENAPRYAVFKAYIEEKGGIDKATETDFKNAANLAKNLTINFNRSGWLGPYVNSLFVFANASIQGSVNFFRGMVPVGFENGKVKWKGMSKAKAKIMNGAIGLGGLVALYNTMVSGEDEDGKLFIDKIPQHEQERFLIVMLPGVTRGRGVPRLNKKTNKYEVNGKPVALAIPLPYGYNMFFNMGRMTVELGTSKVAGYERRTAGEMAKDMAGVIVGSFSPVGIAYNREGTDFFKTLIPSVAKPIYEIKTNEKWTGAPVYKEQIYGGKLPKSAVKLRSTEEFYRSFAQFVNKATGGGRFDPGAFDFSPDTMKFLLQSYLGGLYSTAQRTTTFGQNVFDAAIKGETKNFALNEIPFLRIVTAEPENYVDAQEFYKTKEFLDTKIKEYKEYKKEGTKAELAEYVKRTGFKNEWISLQKQQQDAEKKISNQRKREVLAEKLKDKDYAKYYMITEDAEEQRNKIQQQFNKRARRYLD